MCYHRSPTLQNQPQLSPYSFGQGYPEAFPERVYRLSCKVLLSPVAGPSFTLPPREAGIRTRSRSLSHSLPSCAHVYTEP